MPRPTNEEWQLRIEIGETYRYLENALTELDSIIRHSVKSTRQPLTRARLKIYLLEELDLVYDAKVVAEGWLASNAWKGLSSKNARKYKPLEKHEYGRTEQSLLKMLTDPEIDQIVKSVDKKLKYVLEQEPEMNDLFGDFTNYNKYADAIGTMRVHWITFKNNLKALKQEYEDHLSGKRAKAFIRKSSRVKIADAGLVSMLEDLHDQTGKVLNTAKRMRTQSSSGASSTPSRSITPGNSQSASSSSGPGPSRSETTSTYRTPDEAKKDNAIPVTVSEADQLAIRNRKKNLGAVELKPSNTRAYLAVKDDVLVAIGREVPPLKQFYGRKVRKQGDSYRIVG